MRVNSAAVSEHLLGAWLGARHGGWESRGSWALPDPLPGESFLPSPSRGNSFPPRSAPGPACAPLPAQAGPWHRRPSATTSPALGAGWVQALEDAGIARLLPERISIISQVLGKVSLGSPVSSALAVVLAVVVGCFLMSKDLPRQLGESRSLQRTRLSLALCL